MLTAEYSSPVGPLLLVSSGEALTGLYMERQAHLPVIPEAVNDPGLSLFRTVRDRLDSYFAGEAPPVNDIPVAPEGGKFRQIVWSLLRKIPYGSSATYGELAKKTAALLGKPAMSAQAVGGAVGHNPIGILIPCHRVLGTGGSLTGYAGGLERKRFLLRLERIPFRE